MIDMIHCDQEVAGTTGSGVLPTLQRCTDCWRFQTAFGAVLGVSFYEAKSWRVNRFLEHALADCW